MNIDLLVVILSCCFIIVSVIIFKFAKGNSDKNIYLRLFSSIAFDILTAYVEKTAKDKTEFDSLQDYVDHVKEFLMKELRNYVNKFEDISTSIKNIINSQALDMIVDEIIQESFKDLEATYNEIKAYNKKIANKEEILELKEEKIKVIE